MTLDNRKHKTVFPDLRQANLVSPKIVPAYCMKTFQAAVQGERSKTEHPSPSELRGQDWELKEAKVPRICGTEDQWGQSFLERKESSRKKAPDIFRGFATSLQLNIVSKLSTGVWENYQRLGPELSETNAQNDSWNSHSTVNNLVPTRWSGKTSWYMEHQVQYSEELISVLRDKVSSRLIELSN